MSRRTGRTSEKEKADFLTRYASGQSVGAACKTAGIARSTAYRLRATDEDFATAWDEAKEEGNEVLEDEARRRAVDGWDEPVYYRGAVVGHVRKYDSTLLIFLLKARRPEKFRDTVAVQHSGSIGTPSAKELERYRKQGTDPELEDALARLAAIDAARSQGREEGSAGAPTTPLRDTLRNTHPPGETNATP